MDRTILVYSHWDNKLPTLLGFLYISENRGKEIYSFEFDQKWLATNGYPIIDPELYYYPGRQYAENGDKLFGIIAVTEIETMKKTIEANFDRVMKECRISDSSKRIMEPAFQRVL